jgi:hypothetical protein
MYNDFGRDGGTREEEEPCPARFGWEEILLFFVFIIALFFQINPVFILFCFCNSCFFVT